MKGVVLAGGKATRLRPLTKVTNKHLLPIYDKPLIYYPLQAMARAGIRDVLVITNPEHAGHFIQLLGSGREFGLKLAYELQEEAGGLAQAVGLAEIVRRRRQDAGAARRQHLHPRPAAGRRALLRRRSAAP